MTDAQFVELMAVVREIRNALVPPPVTETEGCEHPESMRVSFATPKDPGRWMCAVCRYEHAVIPVCGTPS